MLLGRRSYAFKPRAGVMLLKEAREPTYMPTFILVLLRHCKKAPVLP